MVPVGLAGLATSTPARSGVEVAGRRLEAVLRPGGDADRLEVERAQDVAVARIAGLADRHLLAALEERGEGEDEGGRRAGGHHHPAGVEVDAVPVAVEPRDARRGAPAARAPRCSRARPPPWRAASAARAAAGAGVPGWPTSMWITERPAASAARAASITSITMKGSTSPRWDLRILSPFAAGALTSGPRAPAKVPFTIEGTPRPRVAGDAAAALACAIGRRRRRCGSWRACWR